MPQLQNGTNNLPYPKLIADLLAEPLHSRIEIFLSLGDALERVPAKI